MLKRLRIGLHYIDKDSASEEQKMAQLLDSRMAKDGTHIYALCSRGQASGQNETIGGFTEDTWVEN